MKYYVNLELICHVLHKLARERRERFEQLWEREELDSSIFYSYIILGLLPERHLNRIETLNGLVCILYTRFELYVVIEDLEKAIENSRAVLDLCPDGHPDRYLYLNNLAASLVTRFKECGRSADLNEAISRLRVTLKLCSDGRCDRSMLLNNLGIALRTRFQEYGRTADLDEAITRLRSALQLLPDVHPNRSMLLNSLANSLRTRFERCGRVAYLHDAIVLHRVALDLLPNGCPMRSTYLNNLGISLVIRFEQHGRTTDLDEAIEHFRTALELYSNSNPNRSDSLNNLATSLRIRFKQCGQTEDIDESIEHGRAALQIHSDGHPNRFIALNNLAISLDIRFAQCGNAADLDESIRHQRAALKLCPSSRPSRSVPLNNLAVSLRNRFEQQGQTADLEEAIKNHRTALELFPEGHPDRSASLANLSLSLYSRFKKFGNIDDFEACMQLRECATEHEFSSLVVRLRIASQWANFARRLGHCSTSKAYKVAMLLLQRTLVVSPTLNAQYDFLQEKSAHGTLALDAVAYAVEGNRLEEAIEILEQGRCMLWSQMRGFRTPLDHLAETNEELADKFRNVTCQLENLATSYSMFHTDSDAVRSGSSVTDVHRDQTLFERRLKLKRKLSNKQKELIDGIRQIPGFENFLTATPFKVLQQAASEGPVIVVNRSIYRSDALIVLSREDLPVVCVPLDGEFYNDSVDLCADLLETRTSFGAGSSEYNERLVEAMKTLWDRVVSKVVDKLKELRVAEGSRIWWCPTSVLSALPFHAAGPFMDAEGTVKYFLDDYVSSYTPTLGALINARSKGSISNPVMLIVGNTITLQLTEAEVRAVCNKTRSYISSYTMYLNERATHNRVLKRLQKVTWIHFACHGHLGSFDASFKLSDGGLTLLDIVRSNLPNAEFAFLSACHTAEQDVYGSYDEVLHLAAAVHFCGFRSVIGTMWELYDADGPLLPERIIHIW